MSTATASPLSGDQTESALSAEQRQALEDAIGSLAKYSDHPVIGGLLGRLEGARDAQSSDRLEAALAKVAIAKSEVEGSEDDDDESPTADEIAARAGLLDELDRVKKSVETEIALRMGDGARRAVEKREAAEGAGSPEYASSLARLPVR